MLRSLIAVSLLSALVVQAGCTKPAAENKGPAVENKKVATEKPPSNAWWCVEHGVPEEECALCSATVAAEFKKKNDWCKQHDRPESQCFICHPELEQKFAARYEAKFGSKPPPRDE